MIEANKLISAM